LEDYSFEISALPTRNAALPDFSVRELQATLAVAEQGSFMAAALVLDISQPALTRTVQRVERVLGTELFRRTTRKLEVTAAGRQFLAMASRILDDLRLSVQSLRDQSDEESGQVILSAVMSVAYSRMPPIIAAHRKLYPRIEIQLHEGVHGTVLDTIRNGVSDLGITYLDRLTDEFEGIPLGQEAFHVVLPLRHPLARRKSIDFSEAAGFDMVCLPREAETRRLIDGHAVSSGLTLRQAVVVDQFATLMECVKAGVGLAIIPGGAIPAARHAGLVTRPLSHPSIRRNVGAVLLRGRGLTPAARGFLSQLKDRWGNEAPDLCV
jgi:DNA-binding transcriptional LysR family regulator